MPYRRPIQNLDAMYDEIGRMSRVRRRVPTLVDTFREVREFESEVERLTPHQVRLVDLAEKGERTMDKLEFLRRIALSRRNLAAQTATGSASALLAAGRARRQAQRDWNLGMRTGDRNSTADAAHRLDAAKAQYATHRSRLLDLRNAQRKANAAALRLQRVIPIAQRRSARVKQGLAVKPTTAEKIARFLLRRR